MMKDTDQQAVEEIQRVRSGKVPSTGASVSVERGASPVRCMVVFRKLPEPPTTGTLCRLPHTGTTAY